MRSRVLVLMIFLKSSFPGKCQGAETTINMMGAMPAVAVRLERRKAEKRLKRPSQLYLGGYNIRQTTSPNRGSSPSPSPLLSPPRSDEDQYFPEIYVCGKISALHLAVVSLLLGAVILIVGLVQLKPGADAPGHRYYLIAIGCMLELIGLIITTTRCILLHLKIERRRRSRKAVRTSVSQQGGATIVTNVENPTDAKSQQSSEPDSKYINLKHLYNSNDVIYIDDSDHGGRNKSPGESISTIEVLMANKAEMRRTGPAPDACSLAMVSPTEFDTLLTLSDQPGTT